WTPDQIPTIARTLGRFNGAYLVDRPLPDQPWLSRRWLRGWVEERAGVVHLIVDAGIWDHPPFNAAGDAGLPTRLLSLWEERTALLDALEAQPQTFCHLDAGASNILTRHRADGGSEIVALDWAHAGLGPPGEDLAQLVGSLGQRSVVAGIERRAVEGPAFAAYLDGLGDAGWHADPRTVRFNYCASGALRSAFAPLWAALRAARDEVQQAQIERRFGEPFGDWVQRVLRHSTLMVDHADEARQMLHER
ncbi:MAG: phosphotransferase, partial [Dehalococcoidia bacterium]